MLNKIDEIINTNNLDNEKINEILKSKYLKSIKPEYLKKLYKEIGIKVCHKFIYGKLSLEIDMHSICYDDEKTMFVKYDRYKSLLISKMEDSDNYEYESNIESDIELITYVDEISLKRENKHIKTIIVKKDGKEYRLSPSDHLNEGRYQLLGMIDDKYIVNDTKKDKSLIEYCAHTAIDEVYGLEGNWGLIDIKGNWIIKPKYVYPFLEYGDNLQVMMPHEYKKINGKTKVITLKHGLIDKLGKVIIPIKYIYMECMDNSGTYFRMLDPITCKAGVIDKFNNIVVPFNYEYIYDPDLELCEYNGHGSIYPDYIEQVKVVNNDLVGIYDLKLNKEIIKPKYKYMKIVGYNKFLIGEDYENCNTLINELEKMV
nr:WG repeat-containing protein [Bacilli bacterium]